MFRDADEERKGKLKYVADVFFLFFLIVFLLFSSHLSSILFGRGRMRTRRHVLDTA